MRRIWSARALIGIVLFVNIQSAVFFLIQPERYIYSFELTGAAGAAALRGFAILFLMWNVPYFFALLQPVKNTISLIEANVMQFIGLLGETLLYFSLHEQHTLLPGSILRFIVFDGFGLVLLSIALWIVSPLRVKNSG